MPISQRWQMQLVERITVTPWQLKEQAEERERDVRFRRCVKGTLLLSKAPLASLFVSQGASSIASAEMPCQHQNRLGRILG